LRTSTRQSIFRRVFSAVDCGRVVNYDSGKAQVEGGVIFGLSAALKSKITFDKGKVVQRNFDTFEILTYEETPEIVVDFRDSNEAPGGLGEPPVPPAIAALVNAVSNLRRERVRKLPVISGN